MWKICLSDNQSAEAVASILDFNIYSVGETDRPVHWDRERVQKHASQAEEQIDLL